MPGINTVSTIPNTNKDIVNQFIEFFQDKKFPWKATELVDTHYITKIEEIANNYPEKKSLYVNWTDLNRYDDELALRILHKPDEYIPFMEQAVFELTPADAKCSPHVRIVNFMSFTSLFKCKTEVGKIISLDTLVRKVRQQYKLCEIAVFKCNKCGFDITFPQQYLEGLQEPLICPNCEKDVAHTTWKMIYEKSEFIDAEDITIEDPRDEIIGVEPYQILVLFKDDLTQKVMPGQRIRMNGVFRVFPKYSRGNKKSLKFGQYLECHSIENLSSTYDIIKISPAEKNQIREFSKKTNLRRLIKSMIAPFIYGLDDIKEALALFLFGGVEKFDEKGMHIRGDFHILLIGDPGLGKSQLLKYITKISPKGIYTSGKSSTAAGLTSTATKDEDGWVIESGVLPQADRGIACIDEIDKMRETDRDSIHEALEQQTISGAKGGHHFELQARCSVLAAANPKEGRFNIYKSYLEQVDLDHTLLSRFALTYPIIDKIDEVIDKHMARYILDKTQALKETMYSDDKDILEQAEKEINLPMDLELFIKYIAYAKQNIFPSIPKEIREKITNYYVSQRSLGKTDPDEETRIPLTPRQIEDIARLVEASARMRLDDVANEEDFQHAINVFTNAMNKIACDTKGRMDIDKIYSGTSGEIRSYEMTLKDTALQLQKRFSSLMIPYDALRAELRLQQVPDKVIEDGIDHMTRTGKFMDSKDGTFVINFN